MLVKPPLAELLPIRARASFTTESLAAERDPSTPLKILYAIGSIISRNLVGNCQNGSQSGERNNLKTAQLCLTKIQQAIAYQDRWGESV